MLWFIVHDECVSDQLQNQDPKPCVQVNLRDGIEKGFAILKDIRGATQVLLIPTARVPGIESPMILAPDAPNYFADAWEARTYIDEALHRTLPRDDFGLAINSAANRSQDQLHIHVDCIRPDVHEALREREASIGNRWAPLMSLYPDTTMRLCGCQESVWVRTIRSDSWPRDFPAGRRIWAIEPWSWSDHPGRMELRDSSFSKIKSIE